MATRNTKRNKSPGHGFYLTNDDGEYDGLGNDRGGKPKLSHMSEFDRDILDRTVHIPDIEFLFTLKQVCNMLAMSYGTMSKRILFFMGRSVGKPRPKEIVAVNVAPSPSDAPMWRVTETEFRRYLVAIGARTY